MVCGCGDTNIGRVTGGQVSLAEEMVCFTSISTSAASKSQISLLRKSYLVE